MKDTNPCRAAAQFHEQVVGDELLLYNTATHKAYSLNATAAAVWKGCDGSRDVSELTHALREVHGVGASRELVELALSELQRDGLVEAAVIADASRRQMLVRMGVAAALLLPVVASVATPAAAQTYSGCTDC